MNTSLNLPKDPYRDCSLLGISLSHRLLFYISHFFQIATSVGSLPSSLCNHTLPLSPYADYQNLDLPTTLLFIQERRGQTVFVRKSPLLLSPCPQPSQGNITITIQQYQALW